MLSMISIRLDKSAFVTIKCFWKLCTEACGLDYVFPPDSLWLGSDAGRQLCSCILLPYISPFFNSIILIFTYHFSITTWCDLKQNHMAVAYFPWYFTRRPAWKPRPRRGSGFHAGSASEVSWKICNNKCGFVFIPRLYPWIYQATHITHLDWLPKYDFVTETTGTAVNGLYKFCLYGLCVHFGCFPIPLVVDIQMLR